MQLPHDSGPIYRETIMNRFPVEPFNTYSNILFLLTLIYFGFKVYKHPKQHLFICSVIPVIFIGYIGGTVYHAKRSAEVWLLMDWVPIMVACLAVAIYFIFKAVHKTWQRFLWIVATFAINIGIRAMPIPKTLAISIGYISTAIALLLPIFIYLYSTKWKNTVWVLLAIGSFTLAISCRIADKHLTFLTMGTHWLWHSFGAIAVFFLMNYIYKDDLSLNNQDEMI